MSFPLSDTPELYANVLAEFKKPRVVTPTLVILLGSSPAEAAAEAKRQLRMLNDRDRRRIAFLYIDIDRRMVAETLQAFNARYNVRFLEMSERIEVPHDIKLTDKQRQTTTPSRLGYGQAKEPQTFIGHLVPESHDAGAGGNRNNGHTALCFNYERVYNKIDEAIKIITNLDNEQGATAVTYLSVHIVAFLGGGTGSGILADIAVMARQALKNTAAMKHRLNLFCVLPENLKGAAPNLPKARSNAGATLMELMALSLVGKGTETAYTKWFRKTPIDVEGAIADEIFLIGRSNMTSTRDIARIVGFDLAQRIADASGIGQLEQSKCVDRHQLGGYTSDWRKLLTMLSISCPVETCFPAEDTAIAFAQVAAARILPLIGEGNTRANLQGFSEERRRAIVAAWDKVGALSDNTSDPLVLQRPEEIDLEQLRHFRSTNDLESLKERVTRARNDVAQRLSAIIDYKRRFEEDRLRQANLSSENAVGLLGQRKAALQELDAEYAVYQLELKRRHIAQPDLPQPNVGSDILHALLPVQKGNAARKLADAYNIYQEDYAQAARHSQIEGLLVQLREKAQEAIRQIDNTIRSANFAGAARDLKEQGEGSQSWRGKIEQPHPHQRHLFDLEAFARTNGQNDAVIRLFGKAVAAKAHADPRLVKDELPPDLVDTLDYAELVQYTLEAVTRQSVRPGAAERAGDGDLSQISTAQLGQRVVEVLRDYFMRWFMGRNLIKLLEDAAPPPPSGLRRDQQITAYLADHLRELGERLRNMVDINPSISLDVKPDKSIYIGMHVKDGQNQDILDNALYGLDAMSNHQFATLIDPHRLQVSAGVHGFSLSNIRQLYNIGANTLISDYLEKQKEWEDSGGRGQPAHSSSEMERLVWDPEALNAGHHLPDRVIRTGSDDQNYSDLHRDGPGHGYEQPA